MTHDECFMNAYSFRFRALKALDKKTHELGSFESKIKSMQEAYMQVEDKLQRAEKLLSVTKAELEKLKSSQAKRVSAFHNISILAKVVTFATEEERGGGVGSIW